MSTILLEIGYHTNLQSTHVLTFHTHLGKVSLDASSCRSRFLLLLPASQQHHPSLSNNPSLYNFSPALIHKMPPTLSMYCIGKYVEMAKSTCDISWESLSVMKKFMECCDCVPRSTGRVSWNSQWKNQELSFGAMHLTTTVTLPFESFIDLNLSQKVSAMVCFHCLSRECNQHI